MPPSPISTSMPPRKGPSLAILIAISSIGPVAMNIYLPSMSGMVADFGTTSGMVQLTMSIYFATIGLAQLFLGPLSDRVGRRPVILGGLALFVVGSVLCVMAPTIEALIAARIVQAIGGSCLVLPRAIIRDLYDRENSASMIGYVTMGMSIGPMIGPAVGGWLDESFGWSGGFYLMLGLGIAVLAASIFNLPETHQNSTAAGGLKGLWNNYWALVRERFFWAYSLTAMFTSSVYFSILGGTPFIAAGLLELSPAAIGLWFLFISIGYTLGNYLSGRFAARIGILKMILLGSVFPTTAVIFLAFVTYADGLTPLTYFAPMFLIGLGNGMCLPSAIAGAVSVRPDLAGSASGLVGSIQIGFGAVCSALVAWALSDTMFPDTAWPMIGVMLFGIVATFGSVVAILTLASGRSEAA